MSPLPPPIHGLRFRIGSAASRTRSPGGDVDAVVAPGTRDVVPCRGLGLMGLRHPSTTLRNECPSASPPKEPLAWIAYHIRGGGHAGAWRGGRPWGAGFVAEAYGAPLDRILAQAKAEFLKRCTAVFM